MAKTKKQFRKLSETRKIKQLKEARKEEDLSIQTGGFAQFLNTSYAFMRPKGFKAHITFIKCIPETWRSYKSIHSKKIYVSNVSTETIGKGFKKPAYTKQDVAMFKAFHDGVKNYGKQS